MGNPKRYKVSIIEPSHRVIRFVLCEIGTPCINQTLALASDSLRYHALDGHCKNGEERTPYC